MKIMHLTETLQELCKNTKKYGMFISLSSFDGALTFAELLKAAPYLGQGENTDQLMADGYGYLLFDDENEMKAYYNQTVADDGPTKINPYNGKTKVYALTCYPDGSLGTENT